MSAGRSPLSSRAPSASVSSGGAHEHLDADALLVALTLSPATYSRNRFFEMYRSAEMARTRRRAGQLRGVVASLVTSAGKEGAGRVASIDEDEDGGATVVYEVASLGLRRTLVLRSLEMALLRYCVGRARGEQTPELLTPRPADRDRIAVALQRLSPLARDIRAEE
ncbi:MAG: hypothetical protein U0441_34430 [Polyangiaceae bacterium]